MIENKLIMNLLSHAIVLGSFDTESSHKQRSEYNTSVVPFLYRILLELNKMLSVKMHVDMHRRKLATIKTTQNGARARICVVLIVAKTSVQKEDDTDIILHRLHCRVILTCPCRPDS